MFTPKESVILKKKIGKNLVGDICSWSSSIPIYMKPYMSYMYIKRSNVTVLHAYEDLQ